MGFRLRITGSARRQVCRVLVRECAAVLRLLARPPALPRFAHEFRRHGKRLRAILQLARPGLARKDFRRESDHWVALGRRLAPQRDRDAQREIIAQLGRRYPDLMTRADATLVRKRLAAVHPVRDITRRELPGWRKQVLASRSRISRWEPALDWKSVLAAHGDAFQTCRKRWKRALRDQARRHSWRKSASVMRHQSRALAELWPEVMEQQEHAWEDLADLLGKEHDLSQLDRALAGMAEPAAQRIRRAARRWRSTLAAQANGMGNRLHAERTAAFRRRIRAYAALVRS